MSISSPDAGMWTPLIVSRISALCFQRRRLTGLRVIHRRDECLPSGQCMIHICM